MVPVNATPRDLLDVVDRLLDAGVSYPKVAAQTGVSTKTVERRSRARKAGLDGTVMDLSDLAKKQRTQSASAASKPQSPTCEPLDGQSSLTGHPDSYERELTATDSNCICSVADLLAAHDVDPAKVVILDQSHNAWTTPGPDGTTLQMHQVKVRIATKAEHLYRPANPIRFATPHVRPAMHGKTAAFIPDAQIGFVWDRRHAYLEPLHDRRAIDCAWKMVAAQQPEWIFLLGDMLDLASLSTKFARPATYNQTVQPSIDELYWWLARLRAENPDAKIIYQAGNHEARIGKMVDERATELGGLTQAGKSTPILSLRHLLRLDELDIHPVETYGDGTWLWKGDADVPMLVHHGELVGGGSCGTAKKAAARGRYHSVFGHVHRNESYSTTTHGPDGVYHVHTLTPGCLCRVDGSVPGVTRSPDWQQGLGFATLVDRVVHPELVAIQDGIAVRGGTVYAGNDCAPNVSSDMDWPQMVKQVKM